MILASQLSFTVTGKRLLDGVNYRARPGRVSVIMGKNGAGKSTLLKLLAGYDLGGEVAGAAVDVPRQERGAVQMDGRAMVDYSAKILARKRAVLAQATTVSFHLSVAEVVELGLYNRYHELTSKQRRRLVNDYLDLLDLQDFATRPFPTLSGGEQKRVLLAKCLLQLARAKADSPTPPNAKTNNRYLLLDEPTAALDVEQQYRFTELFTTLARRDGIGVVAVLHDLNLAARFADDLHFLRDGRTVVAGPTAEVLTRENVRRTFDVDCLIQPHPKLPHPLITLLPYEQSHQATTYPISRPAAGKTQAAHARLG